ncbi:CBS domain-containing protein [Vibrio metschnikovii]
MLVKDVMIRDVVTISPFAKLREAMMLMKKHHLKSLVVEQQNANDAVWSNHLYRYCKNSDC